MHYNLKTTTGLAVAVREKSFRVIDFRYRHKLSNYALKIFPVSQLLHRVKKRKENLFVRAKFVVDTLIRYGPAAAGFKLPEIHTFAFSRQTRLNNVCLIDRKIVNKTKQEQW